MLRIVIAEHPDATVTDGPGGFQQIEISRKRGFFKGPAILQINHYPAEYSGSLWNAQQTAMAGYFGKFPMDRDRRARVMATIADFTFSLAFVSDPPVSPGDDDFRFDLIQKIARHLDACFFIPGYLLDCQGHILIDAGGDFEEEAQFPKASSPLKTGSAGGKNQPKDGEAKIDLHPPSAKRVAARALALAAVSARGLMELHASGQESNESLEESRAKSLAWCQETGIRDELEDAEWQIINTPVGELSDRQHLDSIWRFEGLAVLLWALQLQDMPRYDEVAEADILLPAAGFLNTENALATLKAPSLRPANEINEYGKQILAFHWRLRDFGLNPQPMDFRKFGETAWFGPLDMAWADFDETNELTIGGMALHKADEDTLSTCSSIASERHLASNWLRGDSEIYSDTDTST